MRIHDATLLALIYFGYVLVATLYPFDVSTPSWQSTNSGLTGFFTFSFPRDFILNILLFIPLGVLLYHVPVEYQSKWRTIAIATSIGACASMVIELLQHFFDRDPSAFDVLANSLGTSAGVVVAGVWPRSLAAAGRLCWQRLERSGAVFVLAVFYGAIPLTLSILQSAAPLHVWNPSFPLQLGNEATLDRPWLGKIHFVALYNRALSAEEISHRYNYEPAELDLPEGVVSLYVFDEGDGTVVHDRSGVEPALDLTVEQPDRVRWLEGGNGVEILRPAVLTSGEPARKLAAASKATGELSIEAWVTPHDAVQKGPARIVSFSLNSRTRNFTVGQQGSEIQFRVRTPASGRNGTPLAVTSTNGVESSKLLHVVATYREGVERLYINGSQRQQILDLNQDGIIGLGTTRTGFATTAYAFFYFFPTAFLLAACLSARWRRPLPSLVIAATIAGTLLIAAESLQVLVFQRSVDLRVVAFGLLAAAAGALGGTRTLSD